MIDSYPHCNIERVSVVKLWPTAASPPPRGGRLRVRLRGKTKSSLPTALAVAEPTFASTRVQFGCVVKPNQCHILPDAVVATAFASRRQAGPTRGRAGGEPR